MYGDMYVYGSIATSLKHDTNYVLENGRFAGYSRRPNVTSM